MYRYNSDLSHYSYIDIYKVTGDKVVLICVRNYTKENYEYRNQSTDLKFLITLHQHVIKQILLTIWRLVLEDN
jgi:hypothetical protein